jgi:HlyD family secretion protein
MEEARDNLEREEALAARGLSAQNALANQRRAATRAEAEVAAARAEIRRQEAALMTAQHDLDQVTVIDEMGGVVTRLNVEEGENVVTGTMNNPGTVLLTISDLGIMDVKLEVDETDVVALELGMRGDVRVDAFPDTTFAAAVTEIGHAPIRRSGRAGESSADFEVVLRLDQVVPGFLPGLSASADIVTAVRDSVIAVPIGALVYRDPEEEARRFERGRVRSATDESDAGTDPQETYGVYIMLDGRARFRVVTIGITGERYFELLEGLDEGAEIITGPFSVLRSLEAGDRVKRERSTPL